LLNWTLTLPDCVKPVVELLIVQLIVLTVTPGAIWSSMPTVPLAASAPPLEGKLPPLEQAEAQAMPTTIPESTA
jgi:hypothetical protein